MGNSTRTLQNIVDFVASMADLAPILPAGGYSSSLAMDIASDVMSDMLKERFNWKFNRIIIPPFQTISWQQDYASLSIANIGWLEHAVAVDINNTALPKPIFPIECVRDLERTAYQFGRPDSACWLPNDQLIQGSWPGANQVYTNPLGAVQTPTNPTTNIRDANGNILVLTTYGTTGVTAPVLAVNAPAGTTVNDGTCVWTVADPKAQGIRVSPLPPQSGLVYQMYIIAQARPIRFTSMEQTLDPIPDDYSKYFADGFIAYSHRHSPNPAVQQRFQQRQADWFKALFDARGQGDRERDAAMFVPSRGIMDSPSAIPIGPAWPYGPYGVNG